jgi:hypothetical protein
MPVSTAKPQPQSAPAVLRTNAEAPGAGAAPSKGSISAKLPPPAPEFDDELTPPVSEPIWREAPASKKASAAIAAPASTVAASARALVPPLEAESEIRHPPDPDLEAAAFVDLAPGHQRKRKKYVRVMAPAAGLAVCALAGGSWYLTTKGYNLPQMAQRLQSTERSSSSLAPAGDAPFALPQSEEFRPTYLDNILYMKGYADAKTSPDFESRWLTDLPGFFERDLKLSASAARDYLAIESELVRKLKEAKASLTAKSQDQVVARMRLDEEGAHRRMAALVGGDGAALEKIREFERAQIAQYRAARH